MAELGDPKDGARNGKLFPELIALPGRIAPLERPLPPPAAPRRQASAAPHTTVGTTPTPQAQVSRINQEQEQNPHPAPQM